MIMTVWFDFRIGTGRTAWEVKGRTVLDIGGFKSQMLGWGMFWVWGSMWEDLCWVLGLWLFFRLWLGVFEIGGWFFCKVFHPLLVYVSTVPPPFPIWGGLNFLRLFFRLFTFFLMILVIGWFWLLLCYCYCCCGAYCCWFDGSLSHFYPLYRLSGSTPLLNWGGSQFPDLCIFGWFLWFQFFFCGLYCCYCCLCCCRDGRFFRAESGKMAQLFARPA